MNEIEKKIAFVKNTDTRNAILKKKNIINAAIKRGDWKEAMTYFNEIIALKTLYDGDALVHENYTVGEHTLRVLTQFESQKKFWKLNEVETVMKETIEGFQFFNINKFMHALLLLHDIGKSLGEDSTEQHIYTLPVMEEIIGCLGFRANEITLAKQLVGNDILGEWEKAGDEGPADLSFENVVERIKHLSRLAGVPDRVFFRLQKALYISDASSYPWVLDHYMTMSDAGLLDFAIKRGENVSRLGCLSTYFEGLKGSLSTPILRAAYVPIDFLQQLQRNYTFAETAKGMSFTFGIDRKYSRTVIWNKPLEKGVFRCVVQIEYLTTEKGSFFHFGAIAPSSLSIFEDGAEALGRNAGWAFNFWERWDHTLHSMLRGVQDSDAIDDEETKVPNMATIALEANADAGTLSLFVNGSKAPIAISKVAVPFYLAMSGSHSSFTMLSISHTLKPAPSPRACTYYPSYVPFDCRERLRKGYVITRTPKGDTCVFGVSRTDSRTVFLKKPLEAGILRWTVRPTYIKSSFRGSFFHFGGVGEDSLSKFEDGAQALGWDNVGCSFNFWQRGSDHSLHSVLRGVQDAESVDSEETVVPHGSLLTLEADAKSRTLCYFVDGVKVPMVITDIPIPFYVGMSGSHSSFTMVSLEHTLCPTPSDVPCRFYRDYVPFDSIEREEKDYMLVETPSGILCEFGVARTDSRTVFLDKRLDMGIFRWTVRIHYLTTPDKGSYFHFGAAAAACLGKFDDGTTSLGMTDGCSFNFWQRCDSERSLDSALRGVEDPCPLNTRVTDGALVSLEADIDARTLSFFVDGVKVCGVIARIPVPLYLGMSGSHSAFTIVSLGRVPYATTSSVACVACVACRSCEGL